MLMWERKMWGVKVLMVNTKNENDDMVNKKTRNEGRNNEISMIVGVVIETGKQKQNEKEQSSNGD